MQEEVNRYLAELLTKIEGYMLTPDDEKKIVHDKAGFITGKLMRKKFRRYVSDKTRQSIAEKVILSVKENQPIHLVVPFGGYKHFWNASHPEPDWAELFHFRWMTEYVQPILAAHEPGVILEYVSEDLILPRMNNYPDEALEKYSTAFHKLIGWYGKYAPKNLDIRYWRVSDRHDKLAIINKVEALLPERKAAFNKLSQEDQEQETHRSSRSVYWHGKQDLTSLTEVEKRQRIVESRLIELAFYDVEGSSEFVGDYYWEDNHICICFSFGLSPDNDEFGDLTLQTSPGSIVDYWIGRGVLNDHGSKLQPTIISQQQYNSTRDKLQLVPLNNFKAIEIVPAPAGVEQSK